MLKIGVTGNIASGKTVIREIFGEMGVPTLSCDEIARSLQKEGNALWLDIKKKWGGRYFNADNTLNRVKMASDLLNSKEFKLELERLMHPVIRQELIKTFSDWENKEVKIAVIEVPLLFEAGWEGLFDKTILAYAPEQLQIKRLVENRDMEVETAKKWVTLQDNQEEKKKKVGIVINTSSDINSIRDIVKEIMEIQRRSDI